MANSDSDTDNSNVSSSDSNRTATSKEKPQKRKQEKQSDSVPVNRVKQDDDPSDYQCEWGTCKESIKTMKDFIFHVSFHIADYVQETFTPENPKTGVCFSCGWRDCGAQILGSMIDFNRHVYFHVFHVRLKCLGTLLSREMELGQCMLGTQSRNWIPELPENLECAWSSCGIIFDNPYIFYAHVCHHSEMYPEGKTVPCKCLWTGCETVVRSKHKLKEHLRSHTQEKLIACPTCGGLFVSRTKLADHIRRQAQSDLLRYECSHCNRRFPTERMLREHMRRHVNHYKCPLCEMTCPTPSALRQHARYRHSEEKPFKCGHCEFSAKSSGDLRKHLDSHNVDDQFSCHIEGCEFTARAYCSLALHFKKEHQESEDDDSPRYKCHVCDKTFGRGYPLTYHLKKKHLFQWPPGHSRSRYKLHADGFYRLQTVRYESIDVTEPTAEDENSSSTSSTTNSDKPDGSKNKKKDRTRSTNTKSKQADVPVDPEEPLNLSVPKQTERVQTSVEQHEPLNLTVTAAEKREPQEKQESESSQKRKRKGASPQKKSKVGAGPSKKARVNRETPSFNVNKAVLSVPGSDQQPHTVKNAILSMPFTFVEAPTVHIDRADEAYAPPDENHEHSINPEDSVEDYSQNSFVAVGHEEKDPAGYVPQSSAAAGSGGLRDITCNNSLPTSSGGLQNISYVNALPATSSEGLQNLIYLNTLPFTNSEGTQNVICKQEAVEEGENGQAVYMVSAGAPQLRQGLAIHVGEYGEAEDANLHMLGDVALTATKDLTAITPLEAL